MTHENNNGRDQFTHAIDEYDLQFKDDYRAEFTLSEVKEIINKAREFGKYTYSVYSHNRKKVIGIYSELVERLPGYEVKIINHMKDTGEVGPRKYVSISLSRIGGKEL